MGTLIQDTALREIRAVFDDRTHAGWLLAEKLAHHRGSDGIVLGIPAGGVPVAFEIARSLALPMDLVIVRKIQVPYNTEAGFGAMAPDGEVIFNEWFLKQLDLSDEEIKEQVRKTGEVIAKRTRVFRGGKPFPSLTNKIVIVVDDGLASGYTMLAAVRFVKKKASARIVVAVPTGSKYAVEELLREVDELVCLNVRSGFRYAVAEAYRNWHDLSDDEVLALTQSIRGSEI